MTELLLLAAWSGTGVACSALRPEPDESRWAWAPMAAVLGPLWAAVAADQQALANGRLSGPSHAQNPVMATATTSVDEYIELRDAVATPGFLPDQVTVRPQVSGS